MSTDYSIYVGPMIICQNRRVSEKAKVRGCPTCQDIVWNEQVKFCSQHGQPIVEYERPCEDFEVDAWEVANDRLMLINNNSVGEALEGQPEDTDIFVPNRDEPFILCYGDARDERFQEIKPQDITDATAQMWSSYGADIATLEEVYGKDQVWVVWGMASDIS